LVDEQPPAGKSELFRLAGIQQIGAGHDGGFAFIEMVEADGKKLALGFPPDAAAEIANRIQSAGELAMAQRQGGNAGGQPNTMPAPLVTEHSVVPSEDGDTMLVSFMTGPSSVVVRMSRSRAEKLRASLERGESQIAIQNATGVDNDP